MTFKGKRFTQALKFITVGLLLALSSHDTVAWPAAPYVPDSKLVQRSDLIVVGRVKDGSAKIVTPVPSGYIPDYRVTLLISEILKGKEQRKELSIILHRGLAPVVDGYLDEGWQVSKMHSIFPNVTLTQNSIIIFAINDIPGPALDADVRKDQLWFLRSGDPEWQTQNFQNTVGISASQEIQPLELKPYFLAFLSDHTVEELKRLSAGNSQLAERSRHWLDHLAVEKIRALQDPSERAAQLLPYFLHRDSQPEKSTEWEAERQLVLCGIPGAEKLKPYFLNPDYHAMQGDIMNVWSQTRFPYAVPILIGRLKKEEDFWAHQTETDLKPWTAARQSQYISPTPAQLKSYRSIDEATQYLYNFADPRSEDILRKTLNRWNSLEPSTQEGIASHCRSALEAIKKAATSSGAATE